MQVITKNTGTVKHIAKGAGSPTLCGIPPEKTMKAGGPGLKRNMCATCAAAQGLTNTPLTARGRAQI